MPILRHGRKVKIKCTEKRTAASSQYSNICNRMFFRFGAEFYVKTFSVFNKVFFQQRSIGAKQRSFQRFQQSYQQ